MDRNCEALENILRMSCHLDATQYVNLISESN